MLVFEDNSIKVYASPGGTDYLLIALNGSGGPRPGDNFWGESTFRKLGISCIGIVSKGRNWYPNDSMVAAQRAIKSYMFLFKRVVMYGNSMGGYAVAKYGKLFSVGTGICVAPQASINPMVVGEWDDRFVKYFCPFIHDKMEISSSDLPDKLFLFYDAYDCVDARHAKMISSLSISVVPISVPYTGHDLIEVFAGSERFRSLCESCRSGMKKTVITAASTLRRAQKIEKRVFRMLLHNIQRGNKRALKLLEHNERILSSEDLTVLLRAAIIVYRSQNEVRKAVDLNLRMIEVAPYNTSAMRSMSENCLLIGNMEAALDWARKSVEFAPSEGYGYSILARVLFELGRFEDALSAVVKADDLRPRTPLIMNLREKIEKYAVFDKSERPI